MAQHWFIADTYSSADCFNRTILLVVDADMSLARIAANSPQREYTAREVVDMLELHAGRFGRLHKDHDISRTWLYEYIVKR